VVLFPEVVCIGATCRGHDVIIIKYVQKLQGYLVTLPARNQIIEYLTTGWIVTSFTCTIKKFNLKYVAEFPYMPISNPIDVI
jgi:hypothetical protein